MVLKDVIPPMKSWTIKTRGLSFVHNAIIDFLGGSLLGWQRCGSWRRHNAQRLALYPEQAEHQAARLLEEAVRRGQQKENSFLRFRTAQGGVEPEHGDRFRVSHLAAYCAAPDFARAAILSLLFIAWRPTWRGDTILAGAALPLLSHGRGRFLIWRFVWQETVSCSARHTSGSDESQTRRNTDHISGEVRSLLAQTWPELGRMLSGVLEALPARFPLAAFVYLGGKSCSRAREWVVVCGVLVSRRLL